jgi:hypothetical protein
VHDAATGHRGGTAFDDRLAAVRELRLGNHEAEGLRAFAYDRLGRTDEAREELDVLLNDTMENPRFTKSGELQKLLEKLKYQ